MIETTCRYCGKPLMDEARFCAYCGKPAAQRKVCPECGWTTDDDSVYCNKCGTLLQEAAAERTGKVRSDKLLKIFEGYELYEDEETVFPKAVGNLSIYGDQVEFDVKINFSIGDDFGFFDSARKLPPQIYRLEDMAEAEMIEHIGNIYTLGLRMKDGTGVFLGPGRPGSKEPEEIVELIKLYL